MPNTDDLTEYYEYVTGVPERWRSGDTIWLETVEEAPKVPEMVVVEPPLQLTLQVPCDGTAPNSISGTDYACKKFVAEFSEGINEWNSPGFPLWCLNVRTGEHKAPTERADGGLQCNDWAKIQAAGSSFDYDTELFELYPDVNPQLTWDTFDAKTLRWGLKPAENQIVYSKIGLGNCTGRTDIANPVPLDQDDQGYPEFGKIADAMRDPIAKMRTNTAEMVAWYNANKANTKTLRVHTGQFVGNATA